MVGEREHTTLNAAYKTVNTNDFGILAVGGVKEIKLEKDAKIEDLQSQIQTLMDRIEALETR